MTDTRIGTDPANRITCQLCYGQNGNHQVGCIMGTERQSLTKDCKIVIRGGVPFRGTSRGELYSMTLLECGDEIERLRAEIRSLDQANGGALQEIERLTRDMAALQSQWDDMQQGFVEVFGEPVRDAIELLGATERLRSAHEPGAVSPDQALRGMAVYADEVPPIPASAPSAAEAETPQSRSLFDMADTLIREMRKKNMWGMRSEYDNWTLRITRNEPGADNLHGGKARLACGCIDICTNQRDHDAHGQKSGDVGGK